MTPVEFVFLIMMLLFGIIGIVRGVAKELGVTIMLLVALMILQLMVTMFLPQITQLLNQVFGVSPASVPDDSRDRSPLCFLMLFDLYLVPGRHAGFSRQERRVGFSAWASG